MSDLTAKQIEFLEKHLKIPLFFGRDAAKTMRDQWASEFRRLNAARETAREAVGQLADGEVRAVMSQKIGESESIIMRNTKTPDFDGAHVQLGMVMSAVEVQRLNEQCVAAITRLRPIAERIMDRTPANLGEIQMLWNFLQDKAEHGRKTSTMDSTRSALATVPRLERALLLAMPAQAQEPTGTGVQDAILALEESALLRDAQGRLQEQSDRFATLVGTLTAAFGTSLPPMLVGQITPIRSALAVPDDAAHGAVDQAVTTVTGLIDALDPAATPILAAQASYDDVRGRLESGAHAVLTAHRASNDVLMAPALVSIAARMKSAETAAAAHDYKTANDDIADAVAATDEALQRADALIGFIDLKDDRKQRIDDLKAKVPSAGLHPAVQDLRDKAIKLWDDINQAFTSRSLAQIKACAPAFTDLPGAVDETIRVHKLALIFERKYNEIAHYPGHVDNDIAAFDEVEREHFSDLNTRLRKALADCTYDVTKNIVTSSTLADRANSLGFLIFHKITEAQTYRTSKQAFNTRLNEMLALEGDPTTEPVVDYLARLKGDELHAVGRISKGDFASAQRVYDSSEKEHPKQQELVALAKTYFADTKWLDTNIPVVEGLEKAAAVTAEIDSGKQLKAEALKSKTAKDWPAAASLAAAARARIEAASKSAKAAKEMETAKAGSDEALQAMTASSNPILDRLNAMFNVLKARAESPEDYSAMSQAPIQLVKEGRTLRRAGPDKLEEARAKMQEAIRLIEINLSNYSKRSPFLAELKPIKADKTTIDTEKSGGWKAGTLFDTEINQIEQHIQNAETAGAINTLDMATAAARLKDAAVLIEFIKKNKDAAGVAIKSKEAVDEVVTYVDNTWAKDLQPAAIANLKADKVKLDQDITAKAYIKAGKDGEALAKRAQGIKHLAEQHYWYNDLRQSNLVPALAGLPGTKLYSSEERDQITALETQITDHAASQAYDAARSLIWTVVNLAERCATLETDGAAYEVVRDRVDKALKAAGAKLDGVDGALLDRFQALKERFGGASDLIQGKHFATSQKRLELIEADLALMATDIAEYETCNTARQASGDALAQIGKMSDKSSIEPLVARVFGKHQNAIKLFDGGDYISAMGMFNEVIRECTDALVTAASVVQYGELVSDLKDLSGSDDEGLEDALRRAEGFIEPLRSDQDAMFVFFEVGKAVAGLQEARTLATTDTTAARAKLIEVIDICSAAQLGLTPFSQMRKSADQAETLMSTFLKDHAQAKFVRPKVEEQQARITAAMNAARQAPSKRADSVTAIEAAVAEFHKLRLAADAQVKVQELVDAITPGIETMEKHSHRYAIAEDISAVRTLLGSGQTAAGEYNHTRAIEVLTRARDRQSDALLRAKLQGGQTPSQDELKAILKAEGGSDRLDKMIDKLDAKAQRKIMTEVFKARFGTELNLFKDSRFAENELEKYLLANTTATAQEIEDARNTMSEEDFVAFLEGKHSGTPDELKNKKADIDDRADITAEEYKTRELEKFKNGNPTATPEQIAQREQEIETLTATLNFNMAPEEKAPNIRRFYALMSKLPNTDTLDNESLGLFTLKTGRETAPYYASRRREVVMNGEEGNSPYVSIGLADEIGVVDPDCTPELGEKMTLFSWNTLHEVGHAVDDKLGFMTRRGGELAGWIEHGANVKPIATAIAGKYEFDVDYVTAYMGGNKNPLMPAPANGASDHEWDLRRANACAHVDAIRSGNNPWQSEASARMSQIGDRCYHEAYGGGSSWVSYLASARSKGVSGYQFRAPGEWFSELYAAYHSGKMNSAHPARQWLELL